MLNKLESTLLTTITCCIVVLSIDYWNYTIILALIVLPQKRIILEQEQFQVEHPGCHLVITVITTRNCSIIFICYSCCCFCGEGGGGGGLLIVCFDS